MPIQFQYRIYRQDLQNNPDILYVFGDNLERIGLGGQAAEMRGEPNAIGVATKRSPTMLKDAFFYDETFEDNKRILKEEFSPIVDALEQGKTVVIPSDGLGTGLSRLPETAPQTARFIELIIENLREKYNV